MASIIVSDLSTNDEQQHGMNNTQEVFDVENTANEERSSSSTHFFQRIHDFRESSSASSSKLVTASVTQRWKVILFGQAVAMAAASTNASSFILEYKLGVLLPLFQMSIMYLILSSYLCSFNNKDDDAPEQAPCTNHRYKVPLTSIQLRIPWWIYLLVSIIDVEAGYMTLLSFQFTSLTSTTLLGSLTVPSVMILSRYLLARVFRRPHYIGVCLCLLGGTMTVCSDHFVKKEGNNELTRHSYVGDLLALSAALLYGIGDVVAEFAIKHIDRHEYLGMIGMFGFFISCIQFVFLEWNTLVYLLLDTGVSKLWKVFGTMVWYVGSLVFYYVAASYFLTSSDATLLNLSLQTSSLWACLFSVVAVGAIPPPIFYFAVLLVASGVTIYEVASCSKDEQPPSLTDESKKLMSGLNQAYMSIEESR